MDVRHHAAHRIQHGQPWNRKQKPRASAMLPWAFRQVMMSIVSITATITRATNVACRLGHEIIKPPHRHRLWRQAAYHARGPRIRGRRRIKLSVRKCRCRVRSVNMRGWLPWRRRTIDSATAPRQCCRGPATWLTNMSSPPWCRIQTAGKAAVAEKHLLAVGYVVLRASERFSPQWPRRASAHRRQQNRRARRLRLLDLSSAGSTYAKPNTTSTGEEAPNGAIIRRSTCATR